MPSGSGKPQVFYRYETADGRLVIVDSLGAVPSDVRERVERVELPAERLLKSPVDAAEQGAPLLNGDVPRAAGQLPAAVQTAPAWSVDLPSAALGALMGGLVSALGFIVLSRRASGSAGWLLRLLLFGALALGATGLYLGWLRRSAGLDTSVVASPRQLVDDAEDALRKLETAREQRDQQLEELERLAK